MKVYTNKNEIVADLKAQLSTSQKQIEKAIIRIYEYQTKDEQYAKDVRHYNLIGFRACDARILSSFAQYLLKGYHLSEKQMAIAKRKMPVYAGQLVRQSIEKGLISKTDKGYVFSTTAAKSSVKKEDEKSDIEWKKEFARIEALQEQQAYEAEMRYEMSLNK